MPTGRPHRSSLPLFLGEPQTWLQMARALEKCAEENEPKCVLSTIKEDPAEDPAGGDAAFDDDAKRAGMEEALVALDAFDAFRVLDSPNMDWREAKCILMAFDKQLEEMDLPPNTTPLNPASFKSSDEYEAALGAQVEEICDFLPPVSSDSIRHLPPSNHLPQLRGLMLWWAPRLLQVTQIGGEAKGEFWDRFNKVMDLWKDVPFFDDKCVWFPSDARRDYLARYLCEAAFNGRDRALHEARDADWRADFDLDFHQRYLHLALAKTNRPGAKLDYYRAKRSRAVANHLVDKAAHPENHCECLLTRSYHSVTCFARCSCYTFV